MQQNRMLGRKAMVGVTRELARYAVGSRFEDLPEAVRHEGERAFVNILGCMLGGAKADGIDRLLAALREFSGRPEATLIGRGQRTDILLATLVMRIRRGPTPTTTRIGRQSRPPRTRSRRRSWPWPSASR